MTDYDLHHSETQEEEQEEASAVPAEPNERPIPEGTDENPAGWTEGWRRIPAYRPIDRELDFAYRNVYSNNIERFFLFNMFGGIQVVTVGPSSGLYVGGHMKRLMMW